ncbi:hypothetical protein NDU88_004081 [Pleurodeles waltl]|uniref:Uncharacterized protein n=1 Tax=Pleurodeles waltl TaxID=8319 RepID=A0AAV7M5A6_PLEWA|nr:hypothetical protein NDU88_004081 [Pleurodeles waltl]
MSTSDAPASPEVVASRIPPKKGGKWGSAAPRSKTDERGGPRHRRCPILAIRVAPPRPSWRGPSRLRTGGGQGEQGGPLRFPTPASVRKSAKKKKK